MVQISTSFSLDTEQLTLLNKIWKSTEFTSRSEYIRHCIEKDLEARGGKNAISEEFKAFEDINKALIRQKLEGRVDYGYEKYDKRIAKTASLLEQKKITKEEAAERDRHAEEDYGLVKKRTDEILKRREHKVKPKKRIHSEIFYNRIRKENIAKREAEEEKKRDMQIERDNLEWKRKQKEKHEYEKSPEGIRERKRKEKDDEEKLKQIKRGVEYMHTHYDKLPEYVKADMRKRKRLMRR